jgi:serine/threonine protein kinase
MAARPAQSSTLVQPSNVDSLISPESGMSYPAIYESCWFILKSQGTILDSLVHKIRTIQLDGDSLECLSYVEFLISGLRVTHYVFLSESVDNTIVSVRRFTAEPQRHAETERILSTFLQALVAMNNIFRDLGKSSSALGASERISDSFTPSEVPTGDDAIVCRICDNPIPADVFEEHTRSCLTLYQSRNTATRVDERMAELRGEIARDFLDVPWPGSREKAMSSLFPAVRLSVLFLRALTLDPQISDTFSELSSIYNVLIGFGLREFDRIVARGAGLVREKMTLSDALYGATLILRRCGSEVRPTVHSITDFTFVKRISKGAYAIVFLAVKKKTGDLYAIKATSRRMLQQKNQMQRLLVEKDILLRFQHPSIVSFYYSMVGQNNLYLVTEFLPGGDLFSLLQNLGALGEDVAKVYAIQIVHALQFLRENGIIHRDIKPDNILVSAEGALKLADFGLSYMGVVDRQSGGELGTALSLVGTPDYVAPEICLSQPHSFSVDYWSLGAVIYEFIYGTPPFHAENEMETVRRVVLGHFRFPGDPEVSDMGKDLMTKLLQVEPARRLGHPSISEILNHAWFVGVDLSSPPFVPELVSQLDTTYFEHRYRFDADDEASILMDMQECGAGTDEAGHQFTSAGFSELGQANHRAAQMRDRRRPGPAIPRLSLRGGVRREGDSDGPFRRIRSTTPH